MKKRKNKPTLSPELQRFLSRQVALHHRSRSATGSHPPGTPVARMKSDHRARHLLSPAREGTTRHHNQGLSGRSNDNRLYVDSGYGSSRSIIRGNGITSRIW